MNLVLGRIGTRRDRSAKVAADNVRPVLRVRHQLTLPGRRLRRNLALASFIVYLGAGLWLLHDVGFAIGDSLSRGANARAIWFSRDPTLTAMGFVWMPGPTVFMSFFTVILEPFGQALHAPLLATSVLGALSVFFLASICSRRGLSGFWTVLLVGAYAFSPMTIFHAANGMSEQMYFLFILIIADGLMRWHEDPSIGALSIVSFALAGAMLVRYETIPLVAIVAVFLGLRRATWRERLQTTTLVALPAAYVFVIWLAANKIIMKSWTFFLDGLSGVGSPPLDAAWLPADRTFSSALTFALHRTATIAPTVFLVVALLLFWKRGMRLAGLGLVAIAGVFPLWILYLLPQNRTWGNPRYFAPMSAVAIVAMLWFAADRGGWLGGRRHGLLVARCTMLGVLVASAVVSTEALATIRVSAVESEWYAFQTALGRTPPEGPTIVDDWARVSAIVDQALSDRPKSLILVSFGQAFPLFLMSEHPRQFLADFDPDYEVVVSTKARSVDYIFLTSPKEPLAELVTSDWVEEARTDVGVLWKRRTPVEPVEP